MKGRPTVHPRRVDVGDEVRVPIRSDSDIVLARQRGREIAGEAGFQATDLTLIATVISELARNIVHYAKQGEIRLRIVRNSAETGVVIAAHDRGPGIWNVDKALQVGYSTSGGLGLGLPGVKRLMDEMDIVSTLGEGTKVTATKWRR
jgi:serine/threonine-protein kinase RsbT